MIFYQILNNCTVFINISMKLGMNFNKNKFLNNNLTLKLSFLLKLQF
jgi:hypothetical protein